MANKLVYFLLLILLFSCGSDHRENGQSNDDGEIIRAVKKVRPDFNRDNSYLYIKQQVDFGPRVPDSESHAKCAELLKNTLVSFGWQASIQEGKAKTFNNTDITIKNIVAEYNPHLKARVLLFAHWDSRPFADRDSKYIDQPILGANDGGSGVGILLEVARQISIKPPNIGVDIIFFDAEDYGQPAYAQSNEPASKTWCLGSQYWATTPHKPGYTAKYGILLDMVGSANAYFTYESISMNYAPEILKKVWSNAKKLGYESYFVARETNFVGVDDHSFVNEVASIPSIAIIHYNKLTGGFHPSWHTHNDNMDVIDKETLGVVGETLLLTLYSE